jgi:hypothetical protein
MPSGHLRRWKMPPDAFSARRRPMTRVSSSRRVGE